MKVEEREEVKRKRKIAGMKGWKLKKREVKVEERKEKWRLKKGRGETREVKERRNERVEVAEERSGS